MYIFNKDLLPLKQNQKPKDLLGRVIRIGKQKIGIHVYISNHTIEQISTLSNHKFIQQMKDVTPYCFEKRLKIHDEYYGIITDYSSKAYTVMFASKKEFNTIYRTALIEYTTNRAIKSNLTNRGI